MMPWAKSRIAAAKTIGGMVRAIVTAFIYAFAPKQV
jgi:hypothetical protein